MKKMKNLLENVDWDEMSIYLEQLSEIKYDLETEKEITEDYDRLSTLDLEIEAVASIANLLENMMDCISKGEIK